jgi:small subunit ribosomal protein S20
VSVRPPGGEGARSANCYDARKAQRPARPNRVPEKTVANIKSQIKRDRQNKIRAERNKAVRSELKTRTKSAVRAAEEGTEDAAERLRMAVKRLDKAAAKGIIHPNQASRRKARLMKHVNTVEAENSGE